MPSPFFVDETQRPDGSLAPRDGAQILSSEERMHDLIGRISGFFVDEDMGFALSRLGEVLAGGAAPDVAQTVAERVYEDAVTAAKRVIRGTGNPGADRVARDTFTSVERGRFRVALLDPSPHGMVRDNLLNKVTEQQFVKSMVASIRHRIAELANNQYNGEWRVIFVAPWRKMTKSETYQDPNDQATSFILQTTISDLGDGRLDRDVKAKAHLIEQQVIGFTVVVMDVSGNRDLIREKGDVVGQTQNAQQSGMNAGDLVNALRSAMTPAAPVPAAVPAPFPQRTAPAPLPTVEDDPYPGVPTHDALGVKIHHKRRERLYKESLGGDATETP